MKLRFDAPQAARLILAALVRDGRVTGSAPAYVRFVHNGDFAAAFAEEGAEFYVEVTTGLDMPEDVRQADVIELRALRDSLQR